MSFARDLYRRFRILIHEAASFGVVGAVGFVVTLGGSDLLHFKVGVGPTTAMVVATIVATCVTYVGNRYWSFRRRERTNVPREAVIFFVLNGIGIVIQTVCVDFTYYLLGLHGGIAYNAAVVIGIGLGTLFRFWSYRKWVWVASPAPVAASPGSPVPSTGPGSPWLLQAQDGNVAAQQNGHSAGIHPPGVLGANGHSSPHGRTVRDQQAWTGTSAVDNP